MIALAALVLGALISWDPARNRISDNGRRLWSRIRDVGGILWHASALVVDRVAERWVDRLEATVPDLWWPVAAAGLGLLLAAFPIYRTCRDYTSILGAKQGKEGLGHATTFSRQLNKQVTTRYAGVWELLGREFWAWLWTIQTFIAGTLVLLKWISSKDSSALYVWLGSLGFTIAVALYQHATTFFKDCEKNEEGYHAWLAGDCDMAHGRVVAAQHLGLGMLVRVEPGQRIPIDGFVVPLSQEELTSPPSHRPFRYAVTGEDNVYNPLRALPFRWSQVTGVQAIARSDAPEQEWDERPPVADDDDQPEPLSPAPLQAGGADAAPRPAEDDDGLVVVVGNKRVPDWVDEVEHDSIHAPADGMTPLFLLAGVPQRLKPGQIDQSAVPNRSPWRESMVYVFGFQFLLLLVLSMVSAVQGEGMRDTCEAREPEQRLQDLGRLLVMHVILGAHVIPTSVSTWMLLISQFANGMLFPGVRVKREASLEFSRRVADVVSDKTGTLTTDKMGYQAPIPHTEFRDPVGAVLLLLTNDSVPNPAFDRELAADRAKVDARHRDDLKQRVTDIKAGKSIAIEFGSWDGFTDSVARKLQELRRSIARACSWAALTTAIGFLGQTVRSQSVHAIRSGRKMILASCGRFDDPVCDRKDRRLRECPSLSTCAEEGALFCALATTDASDETRVLIHSQLAPSLPPAGSFRATHVPGTGDCELGETAAGQSFVTASHIGLDLVDEGVAGFLHCQSRGAGAAEWCIILHHKGEFMREYTSRFTLATIWTRNIGTPQAGEVFDEGAPTTTQLLAGGWRPAYPHPTETIPAAPIPAGQPARVAAPLQSLLVQGGGDVVARYADMVDWEQRELRADPRRTFGHAMGLLFIPRLAQPPCDPPAPAVVAARSVEVLHHLLAGRCEHGGAALTGVPEAVRKRGQRRQNAHTAAGRSLGVTLYRMTHLSKFDNPLQPGVDFAFRQLRAAGRRLHICTGDTFLTAKAVAGEIGMVDQEHDDSVLVWSDETCKPLSGWLEHGTHDPNVQGEHARAGRELLEQVIRASARARWLASTGDACPGAVIMCSAKVLQLLRENAPAPTTGQSSRQQSDSIFRVLVETIVGPPDEEQQLADEDESRSREARQQRLRGIVDDPYISFVFFRCKPTEKISAVRLLSQQDNAAMFVGDGPNDAAALTTTPQSVAIAAGSAQAKEASAFEIESWFELPGVMQLSRIYHGSRLYVLRNIIFIGLFVAGIQIGYAHVIKYNDDLLQQSPWSLLLFNVVEQLVGLLLVWGAVSEAWRQRWQDHTMLMGRAFAEAGLSLVVVAAAFIAIKPAVTVDDGSVCDRHCLDVVPLPGASRNCSAYIDSALGSAASIELSQAFFDGGNIYGDEELICLDEEYGLDCDPSCRGAAYGIEALVALMVAVVLRMHVLFARAPVLTIPRSQQFYADPRVKGLLDLSTGLVYGGIFLAFAASCFIFSPVHLGVLATELTRSALAMLVVFVFFRAINNAGGYS